MSSLRKEFQKELLRRNKEVLIKEAIIAIVAEQAVDTQLQQATPVAPQNPPVSTDVPPEGADTTQQNQTPPPEELTVDSMVEKLNVIRGGTSFSDPEVYGQLTTMWNNLPQDQQQTLDSTLNNIGKIVSFADPEEAQQQNTSTPQAPPPPPPPSAAQPPSAATPPAGGGQAPINPTQSV